jgi:hypothetical protein
MHAVYTVYTYIYMVYKVYIRPQFLRILYGLRHLTHLSFSVAATAARDNASVEGVLYPGSASLRSGFRCQSLHQCRSMFLLRYFWIGMVILYLNLSSH